ncbi:Leucine-rich repeat [Sesbania bispinosa]|nr:Leucine-rich repeat [Sesbania bispinosa]
MATSMFHCSCILLILLIYSTLALSQICNPQDKKALLQIKKDLGGDTTFGNQWDPQTDCCTWMGVSCLTTNNRVHILDIRDFDLPHPTPIPPSIANLPYLDMLNLAQIPNLIGPIPQIITKLSNLQSLMISHTNISGQIPEFLSQLKSLYSIDLSYNKLSGQIPTTLSRLNNLQRISLDGNRLTGSLPDSFGSFETRLTTLTLSRNNLTGRIPASFGRLNMAIVDLSWNNLEGDASVLFGSKKEANRIILSGNSFAFDLGKVGMPWGLSGLDINNNQIYGRIPRELAKVKGLVELDVSYNNLCGEIPKGGRLQRFSASSFDHNKCLCGPPLPSCKRPN